MADQEVETVLDVREIDGEPFGDIMAALSQLDRGDRLRLVSSFEPKPLYNVLSDKGFTHETTQVEEDLFHVDISHAD